MISRLLKNLLLSIAILALVVLPVYAEGGPSIQVGDPTCPSPSYANGEYFSYFDNDTQMCVFGPRYRTTAPTYGDADSTLPGLQPFKVPTFMSLDAINNFSVWSYLALIVNLVFVILLIYWVLMMVRGGLAWMNSQGDQATIQKAQKRMTSVIVGIIFLVGFFVVLNLVAAFIGIGNFSEWPKVFSQCGNRADAGKFYYTVQLENPDLTAAQVDARCFGS